MSIKLKANLNNPPISKYQQDAGCSDLQFPEEVHLVRLNPDGGLFMYTIYISGIPSDPCFIASVGNRIVSHDIN